MSTSEPGKQRSIEVCYCSPNMVQEACDYCLAKLEVERLLDVAALNFDEISVSQETDESFNYYNISPKARLNIMTEIEEKEFQKWGRGQ